MRHGGLTSTYPFNSMAIGDSFTVYQQFQHARVAASDYSRKHGWAFSCRIAHDGDRDSLTIYRVANDQIRIDKRGRNARRRLPATNDPTVNQFSEWLATFAVGQSYPMPASYSHLFIAMQAWCELFSIKAQRTVTATVTGGELIIKRIA